MGIWTHGQRLIMQMERKGHGGKTVTVLGGFSDAALLSSLAAQIRQAMGCGVKVDADRIVILGDLRKRLSTWLLQHGATLR